MQGVVKLPRYSKTVVRRTEERMRRLDEEMRRKAEAEGRSLSEVKLQHIRELFA